MAEPQVVLNDPSFISVQSSSNQESPNLSDQSDVQPSNSQQQDVMPLDDIVIDKPEEIEETKDSIKSDPGEGTVESPTTGEGYIFKCVFCERCLGAGDDPKLLECLHNACGSCVNNKLVEQSDGIHRALIECSSCHLSCEVDKIIDNQFLLVTTNPEEVVNKVTELKCSSCNDDAIATSWCIDCTEFICTSCVQAHQRLKITKDHTIKPKEEVENQTSSTTLSPNLFCNVHPHEKLSLFCENCDKLTCRDCQLIEHRDHKYKFTHEIASDSRKEISSMLKDVTYKRELLNKAMDVISDRQSLISEKKHALVNEITQLVVKLTNTINVRGKQLISRLTEVCDSKQKTLQEKREALDQLSKMTDQCIDFTQHALDCGSDMALLYSKRQMTNHLQRIKCKRADIPNPEIPVRINLALEKVPELIKVISTIGQIVVDGRIYPAQSRSPSLLPPHGSLSPGQTRPPQQTSPLSILQQPQQQQPAQQLPQGQIFQPPRMLPPYGQGFHPNMGPQQNQVVSKTVSNSLPSMAPSIPISLAQQLSQNIQRMGQRAPMHRQMVPNLGNRLPNLNHQQQVSSSTHPQGMLQERGNLRGLLQPNGVNAVYVQTGPGQYQAVQPSFAQQYPHRYPNQQVPFRQQMGGNQQRMSHPNQSNPPPYGNRNIQNQFHVQINQQQQQQHAKWHIPQQSRDTHSGGGVYTSSQSSNIPSVNDNFKITLKSQNHSDGKNLPAAVTSTIPKTPSPNHVQGKSDSEQNLDKYCEASVKDLMATIAKLDSNGVQVLAEGRTKTGGSPHVDSSTDDSVAGPSKTGKDNTTDMGKDDPNEDWCSVCLDGGELVCCDRCPKVFHQFCHIPNLSVEESDTWQCLLCLNFAEMPEEAFGEKKEGELSPRDKKAVERILLELYCQYEPSLPFREVLGPEHTDYHAIIKKPVALDTIRQKLDWNSPQCYRKVEDFIQDVRLMFQNAYTYNEVDTQIYNDARYLETFFNEFLDKLLPGYSYLYDEDEVQAPSKKYRRIIND